MACTLRVWHRSTAVLLNQTPAQAARYEAVLNGLEATFGTHAEAGLYSAPRPHRDRRQSYRPPARPRAGRQREH